MHRHGGPAPLSTEGHLPGLDGATGWLNSPPLTPADLRGKVVLVDFWTYTCINWLRTLAYLRAWAETLPRQRLGRRRRPHARVPLRARHRQRPPGGEELHVEYPVALDSDYAVWRAFSNHYWPAVYIADAEGRIRHHQFGEGGYEECERVIQQLLREAGVEGVGDGLARVAPAGFEAQADWTNLGSPETYLGYEQAQNFASPGGAAFDEPRAYIQPESLMLNQWALAGDWTIERGAAVLNRPEGRIAFRFHARDVNLVLRARGTGASVPFRVRVDGEAAR